MKDSVVKQMREDDREDKQNHDLKSETNDYNETEAYKIARAAYEEKSRDVIDRDLYEKFEDEELYDLVEEARAEALKKSTEREREKKSRRKVQKFLYWLIALVMLLKIAVLLSQTLSSAAVYFLVHSTDFSY